MTVAPEHRNRMFEVANAGKLLHLEEQLRGKEPNMVKKPTASSGSEQSLTISSYDEMLLAAAQRGDESLETGRYIITYRDRAVEEGGRYLDSLGLRAADARDFDNQAVGIEDVGDADALVLPEIGVAVVSAEAAQARELNRVNVTAAAADAAIEAIEPEYFVFSSDISADYLRGFRRAIEAISTDADSGETRKQGSVDAESLLWTWGLGVCNVPPSARSGAGIKVAILDTGMDLNHPDFAGRTFVTQTFVGQPVQDLFGHGTHCTGTACGTKTPPGLYPRYGIAHQSTIFVGKVLSNSGSGGTGSVLAGMNWAIANQCTVISMSLGSSAPPQAYYTAAGQAALNAGCLIVAAAGNANGATGAPANSPTIMAVASLDANLHPSGFSNFGKIEIAAPGRDVFSSLPMPQRYGVLSGTSMATPHVAGCAALWAQTSPALRGQALWNKLLATALPLPFPLARVGKGLVQAPL
jgi:subtilisin